MAGSQRFLKPIDKLRDYHLKGRPFWQFAVHIEGCKKQNETTVEPVTVHDLADMARFIAVADFATSNGKRLTGLVDVQLGFTVKAVPFAIVTRNKYAPIPGPDDWMADSVIAFSEKQLGFQLAPLFPLSFTTRAPIDEYSQCLKGTVKSLPGKNA